MGIIRVQIVRGSGAGDAGGWRRIYRGGTALRAGGRCIICVVFNEVVAAKSDIVKV